MQLLEMFYDEIQDAVNRNVPFIIPIGTMEYHGCQASCGMDTLTITGCLRELEKEKEIVVCPPIWYGVSSYAVCGPRPSHFHVDEDAHCAYLYSILKSMIEAGHKNIYLIPFHQTEGDAMKPMTISCYKAAQKVIFEYMENKLGRGWWGSRDFSSYYEDLGGSDDPFTYIKVLRLMGQDAMIKSGPTDHAGKWETSFLMSLYPDLVDLSRCEQNTEWFADNAGESTKEYGDFIVACAMEWLREKIV